MLEVKDISIRFGGLQALGGVSLQVNEFEIVGLIGPNGAGKTTAFNCITGFYQANTGQVIYRGQDVTRMPPHKKAAIGFGRTFQNVGMVKSSTALENLKTAQYARTEYDTVLGLIGSSKARREEKVLAKRAEQILEMLGLGYIRDTVVGSLPYGVLKLLEVGCALATDPQILLLDEPSSGMGPEEAHELGDRLLTLRRELGLTMLLIEHHVPLVTAVCDHVYVLNFGRLLAEGVPSYVKSHPEVVAAYLGGEAPAALAATHEPAVDALLDHPEDLTDEELDEAGEADLPHPTPAVAAMHRGRPKASRTVVPTPSEPVAEAPVRSVPGRGVPADEAPTVTFAPITDATLPVAAAAPQPAPQVEVAPAGGRASGFGRLTRGSLRRRGAQSEPSGSTVAEPVIGSVPAATPRGEPVARAVLDELDDDDARNEDRPLVRVVRPSSAAAAAASATAARGGRTRVPVTRATAEVAPRATVARPLVASVAPEPAARPRAVRAAPPEPSAPVRARATKAPAVATRATATRTVTPRAASPRTAAPRATAPRATAPAAAEPRATAPRATAPRVAEPRAAQPRAAIARETATRATAPRVGAPRVSAGKATAAKAPVGRNARPAAKRPPRATTTTTEDD